MTIQQALEHPWFQLYGNKDNNIRNKKKSETTHFRILTSTG